MTALISATVGGLLTGLFVFIAIVRSDPDSLVSSGGDRNVEIQQVAPSESPANPDGTEDEDAVRGVFEDYGAGVVSVDVSSSEYGAGGGSGFVVSRDGYIVTNQHVLEGAQSVSVRFAGGMREEAEVVGEDASTDIAVLRVDMPEDELSPLTLGNSGDVEVGTPVVAMGNPLNVGLSVTTGIVSGTERPIKAPNDYTINGAVQTDAAISSGSSGGPLLDLGGSVIGINSQVAGVGAGGVSQGIGFAVPVDTVRNSVEQIIENGSVEHGYIGVSMFPAGIDEISAAVGVPKEELTERYGLPENGAIVSDATGGGPADEAGISGGESEEIGGAEVTLGDVVTEVEGEAVLSPDDVIAVVNEKLPGETMTVTVVTPTDENPQPREVEIEVADQPGENDEG